MNTTDILHHADAPAMIQPAADGAQRREAFRAPAPVARPLLATLTLADRSRHTAQLLDISVLGISLLIDPRQIALSSGMVVPRFEIDLPGIGPIECSLDVRHVMPGQVRHPPGTQRAGAAFLHLSPADAMKVTRYVHAAERAHARRL
jgi:c-di-GMP-binding flagellar brake protein YcgR